MEIILFGEFNVFHMTEKGCHIVSVALV